MDNRISVLFYIKRSKATTKSLLPIFLRVSINGGRFETSTQRYIEESKWIASSGRVKGNTEDPRTINTYLDSQRNKVFQIQSRLNIRKSASNN
jgi:hypothetical protein